MNKSNYMKEMAKTTVKNEHGIEFKMDAVLNMMDLELNQELHGQYNFDNDQELFDTYAKAYEEKFGEEWELAKPNPIW